MRNSALLAIVLTSVPGFAVAQLAYSSESGLKSLIVPNSENCEFTFFSDNDDTITFDSLGVDPCFDLKAGDDVFSLRAEAYPEGVTVYTGPGRDTLTLPNGNDVVYAYDDQDELYVLRGGNDTVRIPGVLATGGTNPGKSRETIISPGSGSDRIYFGSRKFEGAVRLRSPNIRVMADEPGKLTIDSYCGRYFDDQTIDFNLPLVVGSKAVSIDAIGCGLSLMGQAGDLNLEQEGGRLNLSVRAPRDQQEDPVEISAKIRNSMALWSNFEVSSKDTDFNWSGLGPASLSAKFAGDRMGGRFRMDTPESFYGSISLLYGDADFSIVAGDRIEVVLDGALSDNNMSFSLISPSTSVVWVPDGGRFPPVVTTGVGKTQALTGREIALKSQVEAAIREQDERSLAEMKADEGARTQAEAMVPGASSGASYVRYEQRSEAAQSSIYYSAAAVRPITEEMSVVGGVVDFGIERSPADEACLEVFVYDRDGGKEDLIVGCGENGDFKDVSRYEEIVVRRAMHDVAISINGQSGFRVDALTVKN